MRRRVPVYGKGHQGLLRLLKAPPPGELPPDLRPDEGCFGAGAAEIGKGSTVYRAALRVHMGASGMPPPTLGLLAAFPALPGLSEIWDLSARREYNQEDLHRYPEL